MASAQQIAVKKEIDDAVAKYEISGIAPPFSTAEMVVMAILCVECEKLKPVSKRRIDRWISRKFKYHKKRLPEDFEDVFNLYEVPLSGPPGEFWVVDTVSKRFCVPITAGRVFLRNVLLKQPSGTFRFLDLPPELRTRIYEMPFSFPDIALRECEVDEIEDKLGCTLWQRKHAAVYGQRDRELMSISSPPLQEIFALLSVNKQIYNEAVPHFYRTNLFRANNMRNLVVWVQNLAPSRLEHVRRLSIRYKPVPSEWLSKMKGTFTTLTLHHAVSILEIDTDDPEWFSQYVKVKSKVAGVSDQMKLKYATPSELPQMYYLAKLVSTVGELTFYGEAPRIEEYLRAHMKK